MSLTNEFDDHCDSHRGEADGSVEGTRRSWPASPSVTYDPVLDAIIVRVPGDPIPARGGLLAAARMAAESTARFLVFDFSEEAPVLAQDDSDGRWGSFIERVVSLASVSNLVSVAMVRGRVSGHRAELCLACNVILVDERGRMACDATAGATYALLCEKLSVGRAEHILLSGDVLGAKALCDASIAAETLEVSDGDGMIRAVLLRLAKRHSGVHAMFRAHRSAFPLKGIAETGVSRF